MKKFLRSFFKFCLFLFYIIDICVMVIYLTLVFMQYGLAIGLYQMLLYPPLLVFFIFLFGIFIAGTILIVKSEKKYNTRKITNKYEIIKDFLTVLTILFYIGDISVILICSLMLFDEIKKMNNPNPLPSSLNISIQSIAIYLIMSIVPFIIVTTVLIIKRRKRKISVKENENQSE